MSLWTTDDKNKILLQLEEMKLPFALVSLARNENGGLKLLGHGGSADVYEAVCHPAGSCALKVIGFESQGIDSDMFRESVNAQKQLAMSVSAVQIYDSTQLWVTLDEHDNVVSASKNEPKETAGTCIKLQFIAMEKLTPVLERTQAGKIVLTPEKLARIDEREILKLAHDIGNVLQSAHRKKILHRDVKLENVFYSKVTRTYKLGDFGIAKKTSDGFASTVAFTKGYAAPEVLHTPDNDRYDNTADIYSFGMMLYVLTNRCRFPDSNTYSVNYDVQYGSGYTLPRPYRITDEFFAVISKMCMYNPDERYQSMDEALADIDSILYGKSTSYAKKNKRQTFAAGVLSLLIGFAYRMIGGGGWISATLIAFGVVLLLSCFWYSEQNLLGNNVGFIYKLYWVGVCAMFALPLLYYTAYNGSANEIYAKILGASLAANISDFIAAHDLIKVGASGLALSIVWIVRGRVLIKKNN
jgi:hypothetical protein